MKRNWLAYSVLILVVLSGAMLLTSCQQQTMLPKDGKCDCELFLTALTCVDFEDLQVGKEYYVYDVFSTGGVKIGVEGFTLSNGYHITTGCTRVDNQNLAGAFGKDMRLQDVNLHFDWGQPIPELSLFFGEYNGELNITINGDRRIFQDFMDIDGQYIGGVRVTSLAGYGNDQGILTLEGGIEDFVIGGQFLWIDHICPAIRRDCIRFEDQPLGATFYNSVSFFDSGAYMTVMPFQWSNLNWTTNGFVYIDNNLMAGGSGQDANINNAGLRIRTASLWHGMKIRFGEYGGNLNIEINGDFRNFDNFQDIHMAVIGGATISVTNGYGNDRGTLLIEGDIHQFIIGGQELWIDDICPII